MVLDARLDRLCELRDAQKVAQEHAEHYRNRDDSDTLY